MSKGTLDICEKYYGTKDIYELFGVDKSASEQEIKKAYYRLSLKTHPDRVPAADQKEATEKFKVLSKLYNVLSNKDSRAIYDERGTVDDGDDTSTNWLARWQQFFKPLTTEDIDNYKKSYIGSETERGDIKKTYLNGKGCKNYMMQTVPFMMCEDEPRIEEIVRKMIDDKEVPEYTAFTKEPKAKRDRRHKKYAREAELASEMQKSEDFSALEKQLAERGAQRQANFTSFIDALEAKYANGAENDEELYESEEDKPKPRARRAGTRTSDRQAAKAKVARKGSK
uniref:J domain-containing protein n=1 Tax=Anopheles atroparvus TaxID=41427 RepID=A0AAG5D131_ANOAO